MKSKIERFGKVSITVEKDYWDKNKAYNRLTIVERQGTRTAYLSRKVVPIGVEITDRNYWITISKWADIPYEIVQELGDSTEVVISQKVVTLKINELQGLIDDINEIIGEGGSIDERIINAISSLKNVLVDGASEEGDTFKKIEDRLSDVEESVGEGGSVDERIAVETNRAQAAEELLREAYESLSQSQVIPKTAEEWAAMTSWEEGVIYRVAGTTSYTDYMYNGTTTIPMATYNNAIDEEPIAGSDNLVKSGGVYDAFRDYLTASSTSKNRLEFSAENPVITSSVSLSFIRYSACNAGDAIKVMGTFVSGSHNLPMYIGFTTELPIAGVTVNNIQTFNTDVNKTFSAPADGYIVIWYHNSNWSNISFQKAIEKTEKIKEELTAEITEINNHLEDVDTDINKILIKTYGDRKDFSLASSVTTNTNNIFFQYLNTPITQVNKIRYKSVVGTINFYKVTLGDTVATYELITSIEDTSTGTKEIDVSVSLEGNQVIGVNGTLAFKGGDFGFTGGNFNVSDGVINQRNSQIILGFEALYITQNTIEEEVARLKEEVEDIETGKSIDTSDLGHSVGKTINDYTNIVVLALDGSGDYNTFDAAYNALNQLSGKNLLIIKSGVYDIIPSEATTSGTAFGYMLKFDILGIGKVVLRCLYTGDDNSIRRYLSVLNFGQSHSHITTVIENITLIADRIRYCVHDEFGSTLSTPSYTHIFKNCKFIHKTEPDSVWSAPRCIGGGLGQNGLVIIENCEFESVINTSVDYHTTANETQGAPSKVIVKNCVLANNTVSGTSVMNRNAECVLIVQGCVLNAEPILNIHESHPDESDMEVISSNNIII